MDCNSCQLPPPVPVVPRRHNEDAKLSQGELQIAQEVAWAKGKGKAFKSLSHGSHTKATKVQMHEPLRSTSSRIVSFKPRENMAQAWLAQALSRTQTALATARNKRRWPQEIYLERVGIIACCQRLGGSAYTCQQKYFARRMSDEGTVLRCMCFQDKLSIWKLRCQTLAVHGRMKVYAHLLCDIL